MITFPNCKINLGLNITGKRNDGYHDLETVFFPVYLHDCLEVIQSANFSFQSSGLQIQGDEGSNLCVKAYHLLKKDFPALPAVQIHLHKAIPMGAGLGGGSADGAYMLMMLNNKFKLGLSEEQLMNYALQIGSDCPFFMVKKPCIAKGRGEILEPVDVDLSAYKLVIVNPGIHISTKEAFAKLRSTSPNLPIKDLIKQPILTWKETLYNDFEKGAFDTYPVIKTIKHDLYKQGALYAAMTGTGSTVFGLFEKDLNVELDYPPEYFTKQINIKKVWQLYGHHTL